MRLGYLIAKVLCLLSLFLEVFVLASSSFDLVNMSLDDFQIWYDENLKYFKYKVPKFDRVVYFEYCASGQGIQISETVFKEYLDLFKYEPGTKIIRKDFSYSYDRLNDCTVYKLDGNPVLRLYKWGCLI